jgi:hypothetical protein
VSDINKPVSNEEVDQWVAGLNDQDKAELRRQMVQHKAVTREAPKEIDWGSLSDAEFQAQVRKLAK